MSDELTVCYAVTPHPRWMRAVREAGWPRARWTCREHSFAWKGEAPGLIHHHGARRWRSPLR